KLRNLRAESEKNVDDGCGEQGEQATARSGDGKQTAHLFLQQLEKHKSELRQFVFHEEHKLQRQISSLVEEIKKLATKNNLLETKISSIETNPCPEMGCNENVYPKETIKPKSVLTGSVRQ